jgi:hypothetical protein
MWIFAHLGTFSQKTGYQTEIIFCMIIMPENFLENVFNSRDGASTETTHRRDARPPSIVFSLLTLYVSLWGTFFHRHYPHKFTFIIIKFFYGILENLEISLSKKNLPPDTDFYFNCYACTKHFLKLANLTFVFYVLFRNNSSGSKHKRKILINQLPVILEPDIRKKFFMMCLKEKILRSHVLTFCDDFRYAWAAIVALCSQGLTKYSKWNRPSRVTQAAASKSKYPHHLSSFNIASSTSFVGFSAPCL